MSFCLAASAEWFVMWLLQDEIEKVQENQEKLSGDVKKLKRTVKDLRETSQRIESMLRAVIRANKIEWQDEDYQEEDEVDQIEAGLSY